MKASRLDYISESATIDITREECKRHLRLTVPSKNPTAYLLIGQPGAGKTRLATMAQELTAGDTVFINNDANRMLHPFYEELFTRYKDKANKMVSLFASKVTEGMIDILSDEKRNLIIEGTGQHPEVQLGTARQLHEKGYRVKVSVMAEKPAISKLQIILRGIRMKEAGIPPRFTSLEDHDAVFNFLPETLDILAHSSFIDSINIWDRELKDLYGEKNLRPAQVLEEFWKEELTKEEKSLIFRYKEEISKMQASLPEEHRRYIEKITASKISLDSQLRKAEEMVLRQPAPDKPYRQKSLGKTQNW